MAKLGREEAREKKKTSAFLMPFSVGSWLQLRELQNPPEGTAEEIWQRIQATAADLDRENEQPAPPPPEKLPPRLPAGGRLKELARHLKGPLGHVFSACLGGAIVALLPPYAKSERIPIPVPVFVVTTSATAPAPLPAPRSTDADPTPDAVPGADAAPGADAGDDEETQLIRKARAAFATNTREGTIETLDAYLRLFPAGRFANAARKMRKSLPAAAKK